MAIKSKSINVKGKVQHVGFRYYTLQTANSLGISGFVKNKPDGSVYIEAEGDEANLDLFIEWCNQGPGHAFVEKIQVSDIPFMNFSVFQIK